MSSATEPTTATATPREPVLICYDDSPHPAVFVIGSRGPTGLKRILEAGVPQQVAEHAGRPLLIVPPPR